MLTPEQIQQIRVKAGLPAQVPTTDSLHSQSATEQRLKEFNDAMQARDEEQSSETSGAILPAKTGEGPLAAGGKAVVNTPSSAFNLAKNLYEAIRHPVKTAEGVYSATKGSGEALGREILSHTALKDRVMKIDPSANEQTFNSIVQGLKDRYGSLDAAQRTATNDPFGFGADVMGIISGGAGLAKDVPALEGAVAKVGKAGQALDATKTAVRGAVAKGLEKSAGKNLEKVLAPTKDAMKVTASKVIPELVDRQKIAFTRQGLSDQVASEVESAGEAVDNAWKSLPANSKENVRPIINALEDSKKKFVVNGTVIEPNAFKAASDLQSIITSVAGDSEMVSSESLRKVRQVWDEAIDKSRGFTRDLSDQDKISIKREATDAIRKVLSDSHPDIAKLNKEYTFWRRVGDVLDETIKRKTGQNKTGLGEIGMSAAGGVAGANFGLKEAAIGAGTVGGIALAMRSPLWNTLSATVKSKLAQAIVEARPADIKKILLPILGDQAAGLLNEADGVNEQ